MSAGQTDRTDQIALPSRFIARIEMTGDWRVGCGAGRPGHIDRLVARDADGAPFIPAKSLTGIWRDACERVARGLDAGAADGVWSRWVTAIFGSQPGAAHEAAYAADRPPQPAALSIRPARLPEALRAHLDGELAAAATFIEPGVRLSRRSGRALDQFLRFEEVSRGGAVLEASCDLVAMAERPQRQAATALLLAGARLVERIGGKRRRGLGRCRLEVIDAAGATVGLSMDWLRRTTPPTEAPIAALRKTGRAGAGDVFGHHPTTTAWRHIGLRLHLETPLAAPAETVGNVVKSLDFVPGTYFLGQISRVMRQFGEKPDPLITGGLVRVLPATPEIDGARGRPLPRLLCAPKLNPDDRLYNPWVDETPLDAREIRAGYVGPFPAGNTRPVYVETPISLRTHNTVEDQSQRPTTDVGGVYSYEAIEAGTVLRTELWLDESVATRLERTDPRWYRRLEGQIRLGVAKKGDYGRARLEVVGAPTVPAPSHACGGRRFAVWLTSDVLLRDDGLRPDPTPAALARVLGREFGVECSVVGEPYAAARRLESWQVSWGLPRPSLLALAAGASVVVEMSAGVCQADLTRVEHRGIGERCAEGFGRVAFDDPLLTSSLADRPRRQIVETQRAARPALLSPAHAAAPFARQLEQAAWRTAIRRGAVELAADERWRVQHFSLDSTKSPTLSALMNAREQVRRMRCDADADRVINRLQALGKKSDEKSPHRVWASLIELLRRPDRAWKLLDSASRARPTITEGGRDVLRARLWIEAVQSLVDATMRAHRRAVEQNTEAAHG